MSEATAEQEPRHVIAKYDDVAASVDEYVNSGASSLALTYTSWPETDLSKIAPYAAKIRSLTINPASAYSWDLSLLGEFEALERLVLVEPQELDLSALPLLKSYRGPWNPKCRLEHCRGIEDLCLVKFRPSTSDMRLFGSLEALRDLELRSTSVVSLFGMNLRALQKLSVFGAPKLTSLEGLVGAPSMRILVLSGCKRLHDLTEVARLEGLETLALSGLTIESLRFLQSMRKLVAFQAVNSLILDGNTLPLAAVREVYFNDKKGYSHSLKQIRQLRALDPC